MVATIKFSQFAKINLTNTANKLVGVSGLTGGSNFYSDYPLTWTTALRPSSPPAGTFGYNSDLGQIEYWNGATWLQLAAGGSGTVNSGSINELAFYASTGNAVSGFMSSPSSVLSTTSGSVPQWSTTLPVALTLPQPVIQGITNGSSAASGVVGEIISNSRNSGAALSASSGIALDVVSITLTPGQWLIFGNVHDQFSSNTGNTLQVWTNTTSATTPDPSKINSFSISNAGSVLQFLGISAPTSNYNVTTNTTVYLSCLSYFTSGSSFISGALYALRVR